MMVDVSPSLPRKTNIAATTVYDPDWVGNWRRGVKGASNMERYIEAVRLREGRRQAVARQQVVSAARRQDTTQSHQVK